MRNILLRADMLETVLGLLVFIIWIAANFARARRKQGRRTPPVPTRPGRAPARMPAHEPRSAEDELREFLEQLGGGAAEPPPPIPEPAGLPPPVRAPSHAPPLRASAPRRDFAPRPSMETRRPKPARSAYQVSELVRAYDEHALARVQVRAPLNLSSFSLPSMAMPALRGAAPMPPIAMGPSAGGAARAYSISQLGLRQRSELRRAFRLQAILSTPAGMR